jgi:hypothetical protein
MKRGIGLPSAVCLVVANMIGVGVFTTSGFALADLHTRCQNSDDVHFEAVSCLGRCDLAPACTLNEVAMTADDVQACLEAPGSRPIARSPARGGFQLDPYGPGEDHYGVLAEWRDSRASETLLELLQQERVRVRSHDGKSGQPSMVIHPPEAPVDAQILRLRPCRAAVRASSPG